MSTPAAGSSVSQEDRRRSLGKYVKRMSSVFKRDKSSKSSASSTPAMPSTPTTKVEPKKEETTAALATAPAAAAVTPSEPITQQLNRSALQHERARALFAKYGLTLESHEWIAAPALPVSVQRVEKPIRMRVHRSCHRCGTTYGADKICTSCEHRRCKKCPRYPKKKAPGEKGKAKEGAERPKKKKLLTVTSKTGGELVYQPVKQRVRRTCHKCENLFVPPTATLCENCRHIRCTKCPREPAKLSKWPNGYPGDAEPNSETEVERELEMARRIWRKPRTRVRWECEECQSLFLDGSPQCPGCGHERCEKCTRKPLKRVKQERQFNPEIVRAVEAKLRALAVDDDLPTSGAEAT
ncbi:uncharacterized protein BDR25DRAFT_291665 [Lindgomyces ingoldianus]|uniref:Uncharacterized protein n=1 Tax=Lindgomyces ingoldianus TaxID=673940 RepID=A0ACB6QLE2_9PLEO|nr:uncharacterized protein BDR25DRAFT_291665 [Lindgomyces ingoldianus]KAF2467687.1 hypothetical protein BDR25DRAFT_291665 [Lindgomyces ingoldianus]